MPPPQGGAPTASYDVRVFSVAKVVGKKATTYRLRWEVGTRRHSRSFSTKALAERLDASRQVVTTAIKSNQHSTERVEAFVTEVMGVLTGQLEAVRSQVDLGQAMLSAPAAGQQAFVKMTQDWTEAYSRLLSATTPFTTPKGS